MSEKGPSMPEPTGPEQPPKPEPASEEKGPQGSSRPSVSGRERGRQPERLGGTPDAASTPSPQPSAPDNSEGQPSATLDQPGESSSDQSLSEDSMPELTSEQEERRDNVIEQLKQTIAQDPEGGKRFGLVSEDGTFNDQKIKEHAEDNIRMGDPRTSPEAFVAIIKRQGIPRDVVSTFLQGRSDDYINAVLDKLGQSDSEPELPAPVPTPEPEPKSEPMPLTDEQEAKRDSILPDVQQQLTDSPELAKELEVMNDDGTLNEEKVKDYASDLIRLQDPTTSLPELQRLISDWNLNRQQVARELFSTRNLASSSPDEIKNFVQALNLDRRVVREALKNAGRSDAEIDEAMADMNGLTDDEMKEQTAFDDLPPEAKAEIGKFQEEMDGLKDAVGSGEDQGELKERAAGLLAKFNNWRKGRESSRHILMNTWTLAFFSALLILIWTIKTGGNAFAGIGKR